jgi:5-methylcytosine-specific restriction endonuclease McrA
LIERKKCRCGNLAEYKHKYKGRKIYGKYCTSCRKNKGNYTKSLICEFCGFKAIHPVQIDVDHIDGNHDNNEPSNLQSLCANCHRLKTILNKDYEKNS